MARRKVTEKEVIDFLEAHRLKYVEEIVKIDSMISVIQSSGLLLTHPRTEKEPIRKQGRPRGADGPLSKSGVTVPVSYDPSSSLDKRILFVLSLKGAANRNDIIREIKIREPKADENKVERNVPVRLSVLLKKGTINGIRKGRLYTYTMPDKPPMRTKK